MLNIIGYRKVYMIISGSLLALSVLAIGFFGFSQGIDFAGGTLWQVRFDESVERGDLAEWLETQAGIAGATITQGGDESYFMRFRDMAEDEHQEVLALMGERFGELEELSFQSIGPAIGAELRTRAIWAVILALLGISLYVAFVFREVSYPISSWVYGVMTLNTLFHDMLIATGLLALLGRFYGVEIDTNFIVALLVIAGFSVHDTIVVFDRIRENLMLAKKNSMDLAEVVNKSVNQTLARSINTSLTFLVILVALFFLGPPNLMAFIFIILIGTIIGTYSSIFVASPLLVWWHKRVEAVKS